MLVYKLGRNAFSLHENILYIRELSLKAALYILSS